MLPHSALTDEFRFATANQPPSAEPAILGDPVEGAVLVADLTGFDDPDGIDLSTLSLQWLRDGVVIEDATGPVLRLGPEDVGAEISLRITYVDDAGTAETVLVSTAPVADADDPGDPASVLVVPARAPGDVLAIDASALEDPDGVDPDSISYQWTSDGVEIAGATGETLALTAEDIGADIAVTVSYTDGAGNAASVEVAVITHHMNAPLGGTLVLGGQGRDIAAGGAGSQIIDGASGDDILLGGGGGDLLLGGAGQDYLLGGIGSDDLSGGDGDDLLVALGGTDTLTGGAGRDVFVLYGEAHTITDFNPEEDTLILLDPAVVVPPDDASPALGWG